MRFAPLGVYLVVLAAPSCGYLQPPEPVGNGDAGDGSIAPSLELLVGYIGGPGNADGLGTAARFNTPSGVALDDAGNIYVSDKGNHTIRKITVAGVVTTLAGAAGVVGSADGTGSAARFNSPAGVAIDSAGTLYVADRGNNTIRQVTVTGVVTTFAGLAGMAGSEDGRGAAARFDRPSGVAVDRTGNVYVADRFNATIRRITAAGDVTTLAGTPHLEGQVDQPGAAARFNRPTGVAVDRAGTVYVVEEGNCTLRKITTAGDVTTLVAADPLVGCPDGTNAAAGLNRPNGVAVDAAGNIYVADVLNFTIRKVTATGEVTTLAGSPGVPGSANSASGTVRFKFPAGVAVDGAGNVYVADAGNSAIRKVTASGYVTTLAGSAARFGSADGTGASVRLDFPAGVAVDSTGNIYVAERGNSIVRKISAAGTATTLAGTARKFASDFVPSDGTGAAARFRFPAGAAVDNAGNIYIADQDNATIRKVTADGVATTFAGTAGMIGSVDGAGAAARFRYPAGVAIDGAGIIYVADHGNATIRKVTAAGVVTTLAGNAGVPGGADGPGTAASFRSPSGVAVDRTGNVYVADTGNSTIRKVTVAGVVTTLAGAAAEPGSADGMGAGARFRFPTGIAIDQAGNLYIADTGNSTIRKVTPTGLTTTVAGTAGVAGILLGAKPRLGSPQYLAIVDDAIIVSDTDAVLVLRHGAR